MKHSKKELEAMSDLQLNRIIAFDINKMEKCKETISQQNKGMFKDSPIRTKATVKTLNDNLMFFDYCNDPSDMMPLVFEEKMTLSPIEPTLPEHDKDLWVVCMDDWLEVWSKNPLRAAAIVYILIKESE